MCGRFTRFRSWQEIHDALRGFLDQLDAPNDYAPSYNVAPTQDVLAVTGDGTRHRAAMMRWGLVPFWAKEIPKGAMFNARFETVAEKPSFRSGWKEGRRCLVVADGYYEWHAEAGVKLPYRVHLPGQPVFCFAGLWAHNSALDMTSCTMLTTVSAPAIAHLHPRMPVILRPGQLRGWLGAGIGADEAAAMVRDAVDDGFEAYPVSSAVGNVRNNAPGLLDRVA